MLGRILASRPAPAAVLAFGASVAFWPHIYSSAVAARWSLLAIGLPLAGWLDPRKLSIPAGAFLATAIAYAVLSIMWTPDRLTGLNETFHLLIFVAAVILGATLPSIYPVMRALAWGAGVSAVFCLLQMMGFSPVDQFAAPAGLLFNRLVAAEFAAVIFAWTVIDRRFSLMSGPLFMLAVCGSRVAIIAAVVGIISVRPRWFLLTTLAGTLTIAAGWFLFVGKTLSALTRFDIWMATISNFSFWGNGIGSFQAAYPRWEYAHSDLLQAVYEFGIGALLLVAFFTVVSIRTRPPALRAAFVCLMVECAVAFPLHLPLSTFMAGLLSGALSQRRVPLRLPRDVCGIVACMVM